MLFYKIISLFVFFFIVTSKVSADDVYQVITAHPHDLEKISPFITTLHKEGRLWMVTVDEKSPSEIFRFLKVKQGLERTFLFKGPETITFSTRKKIEIASYLKMIQAENIQKDVEDLAAFKTRYSGTDENQVAILKVKTRLQSLGYEVSEICQNIRVCNLVADKKGNEQEKIILVEAHIDSVGANFAGADDNASGVAVLLEMARVLKDYSNKKRLRFLITNGEEQGLLGSTHYVKALSSENRLKDIELVINMDMVGYNFNGLVELETDPQFQGLAKWFAELAKMFTSLKSKITLGAWGSDHVPFLKRNIPSILTIENWDTKTPCYHQKCDTPETLNYQYSVEIGKLNVAAVLAKDET
jgi:hypothetical protein